MTIAAYCRVSSRKQKADSQVSEIMKWLHAHGHDDQQVRWYVDKESGKTLRRDAFQRLQQDIFAGKVGMVVIWKLDRLSRRLRDGVNILGDWCERGMKIVIVTQQIELNGAVGRMIAPLLLGLAEIELEYRWERQAAGIEVAKRKGIYKGRKAGTTKAEPNRAKELRAKGLKVSEIAQAMGTSRRTGRDTWRREPETDNPGIIGGKVWYWFHRGRGRWWSWSRLLSMDEAETPACAEQKPRPIAHDGSAA